MKLCPAAKLINLLAFVTSKKRKQSRCKYVKNIFFKCQKNMIHYFYKTMIYFKIMMEMTKKQTIKRWCAKQAHRYRKQIETICWCYHGDH